METPLPRHGQGRAQGRRRATRCAWNLKQGRGWLTAGKRLSFLYEIAKANVTRQSSDAGEPRVINF